MAISERPRLGELRSATNTLNRGRESVTQKHFQVIELLRTEKFMGLPKIFAFPLLSLMTVVSTGYVAREIYQLPPVHRTIHKVLDTSLETFGLKAIQDSPTSTAGNNTNIKIK